MHPDSAQSLIGGSVAGSASQGEDRSGGHSEHLGGTASHAVRTTAPHREVLFQRGHAADVAHDTPRSSKQNADSMTSARPEEIRAGAHFREDAAGIRGSKQQAGGAESYATAPDESHQAGDQPPKNAWSHAAHMIDTNQPSQRGTSHRSLQSKKVDTGVAASANGGDSKTIRPSEASHQDTVSGIKPAARIPDGATTTLSVSVQHLGGTGGGGKPGPSPSTKTPALGNMEPASESNRDGVRQVLPQRTPRGSVQKQSATPGSGARRTVDGSKPTQASGKEAVTRTPISPPASSPPKKRVFGKDAARVAPHSTSTPSSVTGPNERRLVSSAGTPTPEGSSSVFARLGKELEIGSGGGAGGKAAPAGRTIALGNDDEELTLTFQTPRGAKGGRVGGRSGRGNTRDKHDGTVRTVSTNAGGRGKWQNNKRTRDPEVVTEPVVQTVQWSGAMRGGRGGRGGRNSKRQKQ